MLRRSSLTGFSLLFIPLLFVVFAASLIVAPTEVARGKSAAIPLSDELTPEQQEKLRALAPNGWRARR